jgi:hypothetical protein
VFCMSVPLGWKVNDSSMVPRLAPSEVRPTDAMREKSGPNFFYILYHNEVDGKGGCTFSGPADREYASAAGELHDRLFRNTFREAREARGLSRFKRLLWAKFVAPSPLRSSGGRPKEKMGSTAWTFARKGPAQGRAKAPVVSTWCAT